MNDIYWIIECAATFIEISMCSLFCGTFSKNADLKKNFWSRLIVSIVVTIIVILINRIDLFSLMPTIFFVLLFALSQYILYHESFFIAPILSCFFFLISHIFDEIAVKTISYFMGTYSNYIYEKMSIYRVMAIIISKSLLIFFAVIINKLYTKKNNYIATKYSVILFGLTLLTAIVSYFLTFIDIKNKIAFSYTSILMLIIVLILLIIILFGIFKLSEYYESKQQLNLIKLKNQMLEKSLDETEQTFMLWKTSMHDFKHKIMHLITLTQQDDMESIKQFLKEENELIGKTLFYYKTGNDTVDTILNIKQKYAEEKGISFIINAEVPENCNISSFDFSAMLGNLIDNAIEASVNEKSPIINIIIKPVKKMFIISILNKCTKSDKSLVTSKSEKYLHGLGLISVKNTVKKYNGEFNIETSDDFFEVKIMIPMNENQP